MATKRTAAGKSSRQHVAPSSSEANRRPPAKLAGAIAVDDGGRPVVDDGGRPVPQGGSK